MQLSDSVCHMLMCPLHYIYRYSLIAITAHLCKRLRCAQRRLYWAQSTAIHEPCYCATKRWQWTYGKCITEDYITFCVRFHVIHSLMHVRVETQWQEALLPASRSTRPIHNTPHHNKRPSHDFNWSQMDVMDFTYTCAIHTTPNSVSTWGFPYATVLKDLFQPQIRLTESIVASNGENGVVIEGFGEQMLWIPLYCSL